MGFLILTAVHRHGNRVAIFILTTPTVVTRAWFCTSVGDFLCREPSQHRQRSSGFLLLVLGAAGAQISSRDSLKRFELRPEEQLNPHATAVVGANANILLISIMLIAGAPPLGSFYSPVFPQGPADPGVRSAPSL